MRYSHFTRILVIGALLVPLVAVGDRIEGKVVGVSDGDTVTVLDAHQSKWKIRLLGIDAPEKKMPFGQKSKQQLSDLIYNKQVTVEYSKQDRYGRTLGKILVGGIDANLEQVRAGMAWHYKQYRRDQALEDRQIYSDAENSARASRIGLWVDANPTPPWTWRKQRRKKE